MPLPASFPELASLDLFVSVIELGSVSRAAQAHGITQPSASSRIKHLERQLGLTLLDRGPGGSKPTDAGVVVAGWADTDPAGGSRTRRGALGVPRRAHRPPPHLRQLHDRRVPAPPVAGPLLARPSPRLRRPRSRQLDDRRRSPRHGAADLGFIETPSELTGLDEHIVAHDELVTVVAPSHPWAARGTVPVEALAATPLVMREAGSGTREAFEQALRELGLGEPSAVLELGSTSAVRAAVVHGNAPTVISRLAVAAEVDAGQLVEIEVTDLTIGRDLRAVWPSGTGLPTLARALLDDLV